jgi:translation elongation factor EF-Tu-like GTPase
MDRIPDFIAELKYRSTEEGGRKTPALTGIWQHLKFSFIEGYVGGKQRFLNKEIVYPGDDVKVEITVLSPEFLKNTLSIGMRFTFGEASRTTGTGEIIEIINKDLLLTIPLPQV